MSVFRVPDQAAFDALQAKLKPRMVSAERVKPKVKVSGRPESGIEAQLAQQLGSMGIKDYKRNHVFLHGRRFELDFAWPDQRIGVEVQGNVHRIKHHFKAGIEKAALGILAGWRIMPVGGDEVRSGQAAQWVKLLLNLKP